MKKKIKKTKKWSKSKARIPIPLTPDAPVTLSGVPGCVLEPKLTLDTTSTFSMPSRGEYSIILKTSGLEYKAEGETIDEAIANLGLSWEQIKAKGVFIISDGSKTIEHLFYSKQLKRIFANKLTRSMWAKRLKLFLVKGEKHYNWQGGKSLEEYGFNWTENLKESIRQRDEYTCQLCGIHQDELNEKLNCHHIDYDKKNLNPDNLIILCRCCHTKTNHNRDFWIIYFNNLND